MDDLTDLEHRLDALEQWQGTEKALKAAKAEQTSAKHTVWQVLLSVVSSATMVVNLYLTVHPHK
jgi:hypothetical protein